MYVGCWIEFSWRIHGVLSSSLIGTSNLILIITLQEQSFDLESLETAVNSNWIDKDDDILSDMDMIVLVFDMGL